MSWSEMHQDFTSKVEVRGHDVLCKESVLAVTVTES